MYVRLTGVSLHINILLTFYRGLEVFKKIVTELPTFIDTYYFFYCLYTLGVLGPFPPEVSISVSPPPPGTFPPRAFHPRKFPPET